MGGEEGVKQEGEAEQGGANAEGETQACNGRPGHSADVADDDNQQRMLRAPSSLSGMDVGGEQKGNNGRAERR